MCITPNITLPDEILDQLNVIIGTPPGGRRRRQAGVELEKPVNTQTEVDVYVGFQLDGVNAFRNFTGDNNIQFDVYLDPKLDAFEDEIRVFRPFWPYFDTTLDITVSNFEIVVVMDGGTGGLAPTTFSETSIDQ